MTTAEHCRARELLVQVTGACLSLDKARDIMFQEFGVHAMNAVEILAIREGSDVDFNHNQESDSCAAHNQEMGVSFW